MTNAIPALRFDESSRRYSTCQCGQPIKTSCWGWIHTEGLWVTLRECRNAKPRAKAVA